MSEPSADDERGSGVVEDGAVFAPVRVRSTVGPRLLAVGAVLALGGLVAVGALDRQAGGDESSARRDGAAPPAVVARQTSQPGASRVPTTPQERSERFMNGPEVGPYPPPARVIAIDLAPVETSGPGPIQLEARRQPETVFIHGDVFVERITWVFVSLLGTDGRVAGWASVSVPGSASSVGRSGAPALRFDVEVAVPTSFAGGPLVVQANAYDARGSLAASTRLTLEPAN